MRALEDAAKELARAVGTLAPAQGRIARRNARQRVLGALNEARRLLDRDYPAVKLPRGPTVRRTLAQRRKELIDEGWVVTDDVGLLSTVAEQKLPLRRTPAGPLTRGTINPASGLAMIGSQLSTGAQTWVPGWVAHYYMTVAPRERVAKLQEARKNPKMIQAAKAAVRLGSLSEAIKDRVIGVPTR